MMTIKKHRSRLIPINDMRVSSSTIAPRLSNIAHGKQAQKSHGVTDWLELFVLFNKTKLNMVIYSFFFKPFPLDLVMRLFIWNCFWNF